MPTEPKTLIEAVRHFTDLNTCHEYMLNIKWPRGLTTPREANTIIDVSSVMLFHSPEPSHASEHVD